MVTESCAYVRTYALYIMPNQFWSSLKPVHHVNTEISLLQTNWTQLSLWCSWNQFGYSVKVINIAATTVAAWTNAEMKVLLTVSVCNNRISITVYHCWLKGYGGPGKK